MDPAVMTSFLVVGAHVVTAAGVWLYRRHRRRSQSHRPGKRRESGPTTCRMGVESTHFFFYTFPREWGRYGWWLTPMTTYYLPSCLFMSVFPLPSPPPHIWCITLSFSLFRNVMMQSFSVSCEVALHMLLMLLAWLLGNQRVSIFVYHYRRDVFYMAIHCSLKRRLYMMASWVLLWVSGKELSLFGVPKKGDNCFTHYYVCWVSCVFLSAVETRIELVGFSFFVNNFVLV